MQPSRSALRVAGPIALILSATLCFSANDATVKRIGAAIPVVVLVWARYTFQAITMGAWQAWRLRAGMFSSRSKRFQLLRGLVLVGNTCAAYAGLQYLPMAEYTTLTMTTPIIVLLACGPLIGQRVTRSQWQLVILGFVSILVTLRPGSAAFVPAALLPLTVASTQAAFQLLTAQLAGRDDPGTTHFWTGLTGCAVLTAALPVLVPDVASILARMSTAQWLALGFIGLVASAGHMMLIFALARAPIPVLIPFTYVQIPVAALVGWLMFGQLPGGWAALGMAGIAGVGIGSVWQRMRRGAK